MILNVAIKLLLIEATYLDIVNKEENQSNSITVYELFVPR